jgi:hypothetical protein
MPTPHLTTETLFSSIWPFLHMFIIHCNLHIFEAKTLKKSTFFRMDYCTHFKEMKAIGPRRQGNEAKMW